MPPFAENSDESGEEFAEKQNCEGWLDFRTQVIWGNVITTVIHHCILLYYIFTFPYLQHKGLVLWAILLYHLYGTGVTAGAHRLWTHRTYKAKPILRVILAILYCGAGQNKIVQWVRDHRSHHKYTDTDADPHNSKRGFFFSHWGWLMMKKLPEVLERGNTIDMSDVTSDPVVAFFDRRFLFWKILFAFVLPVFIPVYFFDQDLKATIITQWLMRYTGVLHATFSVNSFAHLYGYHSYDKNILPAENQMVAFFAGGEGFHNYHHVFPWDYKTSEFPSPILNLTAAWINLWKKIGWAYDLKEANPEMVKRVAQRKGDGTHPFYIQRDNKSELVCSY